MEQNQTSQIPQTPASPPQGQSSNAWMAIISYLGILVVIPLAMNKNDQFVKFHAKQGLVLLITWFIVWAVTRFFWAIPVLGWFGSQILYLGCFILAIIGIINAANGQTKELPIIGKFASSFKF